jgi:pyruvate,orthophosphate dikinase
MTHELKLPVPPGFTIETKQCQTFLEGGPLPDLNAAIRGQIGQLEKTLGRRFGSNAEPLLVSVRSGAASSMPGMMDTVLNVGMTPATAAALADLSGDALFAFQSYKRFLVSYAGTVLELETKYGPPGQETEAELRADIDDLRQQIARRCGSDALDDP